jgi:peptide-methionine (R)-S-oxide reductase
VRFRRTTPPREVSLEEEGWRALLSPEQFRVLRRKATEAAFSGTNVHPDPHLKGTFRCAGCGADLFDASSQFDSGTGWPSFSTAADGAVERRRDLRMGIPRTEVLCRRCGGHLGHVFGDGPGPDGERYCINSLSLTPPSATDPG